MPKVMLQLLAGENNILETNEIMLITLNADTNVSSLH